MYKNIREKGGRMNKLKDLLYILIVNGLIIFFILTLAVNVIENLNPIYKAIIDMALGIATYFICKDITKILIKEVKECTIKSKKRN